MMNVWEAEQISDAIRLAGEMAPPGKYMDVDTKRVLVLKEEDVLPATLDGRVACYIRVANTWSEQARKS